MVSYVELQAASNFDFLRGASHPEELALTAQVRGLRAFAVTDRNSFAGIVRTHVSAKEYGVGFIPGVRLEMQDAPPLLCYPTDRTAYGRLCQMLTIGKRRARKGTCEIYLGDVLDHAEGSLFIAVQPVAPRGSFRADLVRFKEAFAAHHLWLSVNRHFDGFDEDRLAFTESVERDLAIPAVVTNDVHFHTATRKPLQDVLTCIREHCRLSEAGYRLFPNAERHLKTPDDMAALFPDHPEWLARSLEIAEACQFSLDELRYDYPLESEGSGESSQERLERHTLEGARSRYNGEIPDKIRASLDHEFALIRKMAYAPYFLTVYDIVSFARAQGILCQGRGSAANSAVCYCLYITEVDPNQLSLLFERFISAERDEPPDIDVDFEHERREEVIQYIYRRYGRERAGLTATVIRYRARSAMRDVGKVFGLSEDMINRLTRMVWGSHGGLLEDKHIVESGLDPDDPLIRTVREMAAEIYGFPRHLSQHVGGFVITEGPLCELSPIANAAMEDRTTIEWDKDDIDALGILKVDVLALGMLSCLRKSFDLLARHKGLPLSLSSLPREDPRVYGMLQKADAVGVFQVESRAQLSMLPRLKPRCFYDLVVEVAIVRPGPIQGDMVHPYLRRRNGDEPITYPSEALRGVLEKTHGVPLFQEQAMQVAMVGAGFTGAEADKLRRDMAAFRRIGQVHHHKEKFTAGMLANGYDQDFAEKCFKQIEGFAEYGFPESHAASFANLVYASSWLKCHHPDVFTCALLNSQPMGFYAPAQLIQDAREHGINVLPVDVNASQWDNLLEGPGPRFAIRLGFRQVKGVAALDILALISARPPGGYMDINTVARDSGVSPQALQKLAEADAFASLGLSRRDALWAMRRLGRGKKLPAALPLFEAAQQRSHNMTTSAEFGDERTVVLPPMSMGEEVVEDYTALRLSLKAHPIELLRGQLDQAGLTRCGDLAHHKDGSKVTIAGLAITRQRPGTAKGVMFLTIEDESGIANVVCWAKVFESHRRIAMASTMVGISGKVQREGDVIHLVADRLLDLTGMLQSLGRGTLFKGKSGYHPRNLSWQMEPAVPDIATLETADNPPDATQPVMPVDSRDFH